MKWSVSQVAQFKARKAAMSEAIVVPDVADDVPESTILTKICQHCKENGFYFFHDYSRSVNEPGHPDLVIALPDGRTLWIELKSKRGRLTAEQRLIGMMLRYLCHEFHVVKSYKQFLLLIGR